MKKSSFISIVGRPSSGKSTLINFICKEKISIVAKIPQTTRNRIRGIYSESDVVDNENNIQKADIKKGRGQLIFVDTPGFHISDKKFNKKLSSLVTESISDTDLVLYLIDVTRTIEKEDMAIIKMLTPIKDKVIVALNKMDEYQKVRNNYQPNNPNNVKLEQSYQDSKRILSENFDKVFEISGVSGQNVDLVIDEIFSRSTDETIYFPPEYKTDADIDFRVSEIVREKIITHTKDEIPYSVFVRVLENVTRSNGLHYVRCAIMVDSESQKGIIVGHQGRAIKEISTKARYDLEALFSKEDARANTSNITLESITQDKLAQNILKSQEKLTQEKLQVQDKKPVKKSKTKVYLDLVCKVKNKWRNDENLINKLIF